MIPFIFVITAIAFILLIISFIFRIYSLGMISSMALIVIGVYIGINGMEGINNFLVQSLAIICIALGAYVFINGSLQKIQEVN